MKFYPDRPTPRFARLLLDIGIVIWTGVWIAAGMAMYRLVTGLWTVSDAITGTGRTFNDWLGAFKSAIPRNVPVLGSYLSSTATELQRHTGDPLIQTGAQAHESIHNFAVAIGTLTAAPPIIIVTGLYLLWRWRDAREMGAAAAFVEAAERGGREEQARAVLAFRAIATLSFRRLMRASQDPVGELADHRYDALAAEMLRAMGLESFRLHHRGPPRLEGRPAASLEAPSPAKMRDERDHQDDQGGDTDPEIGRLRPG